MQKYIIYKNEEGDGKDVSEGKDGSEGKDVSEGKDGSEGKEKKYSYIIHISDIHIRLNERHEEYEDVFHRMYSEIDKIVTRKGEGGKEKGLVVITGDTLHDNSSLTAECIKMTICLFQNLASRLKTILILGNHDVRPLFGKEDNITGLLYGKKIENFHFLKYSGIYHFGNIVFGVSSLWDSGEGKDILFPASEIDAYRKDGEEIIKIGLYHGMVGRIELNRLYKAKGQFTAEQFDGYDYVLLGDVHKHQFLDGARRMGYAGSLISQNFKEIGENHGMLLWDIINGGTEYIRIENPYAHKEFTLEDGILTMMGEEGDGDARDVHRRWA